jgi:hypothetical protein
MYNIIDSGSIQISHAVKARKQGIGVYFYVLKNYQILEEF